MFHLIEEQGDKFMEYLVPLVQKSPVQDVHKLIQKFTIGSIAACAFGIDIDINVEDKKLTELHQMITYNYVANDLQFAFPGFFKNFSLEIFPNAITDYFSNLVRAIVTERKGVPSSRRDFMDLLLELKNAGEIHGAKKHENDKERSVRITDTLMAAQAFVFYVGGYETTASTLSFMMHELAYHQDIQDNLVLHINEVLEQNGGKLSFDCLKQMTYLDQTISETLRMYPLGDPLTRKSLSSYKIPGTDVTIDKDTMVFTSARGIHYDEQYYPEPHKFDPERFTPENIKARHPCAYMPFGLGPRNCIGIRFANVQAALGAVLMLTRYRVEPATDVREPFHYDPNLVVFGVTNGVPVRFVPRE